VYELAQHAELEGVTVIRLEGALASMRRRLVVDNFMSVLVVGIEADSAELPVPFPRIVCQVNHRYRTLVIWCDKAEAFRLEKLVLCICLPKTFLGFVESADMHETTLFSSVAVDDFPERRGRPRLVS